MSHHLPTVGDASLQSLKTFHELGEMEATASVRTCAVRLSKWIQGNRKLDIPGCFEKLKQWVQHTRKEISAVSFSTKGVSRKSGLVKKKSAASVSQAPNIKVTLGDGELLPAVLSLPTNDKLRLSSASVKRLLTTVGQLLTKIARRKNGPAKKKSAALISQAPSINATTSPPAQGSSKIRHEADFRRYVRGIFKCPGFKKMSGIKFTKITNPQCDGFEAILDCYCQTGCDCKVEEGVQGPLFAMYKAMCKKKGPGSVLVLQKRYQDMLKKRGKLAKEYAKCTGTRMKRRKGRGGRLRRKRSLGQSASRTASWQKQDARARKACMQDMMKPPFMRYNMVCKKGSNKRCQWMGSQLCRRWIRLCRHGRMEPRVILQFNKYHKFVCLHVKCPQWPSAQRNAAYCHWNKLLAARLKALQESGKSTPGQLKALQQKSTKAFRKFEQALRPAASNVRRESFKNHPLKHQVSSSKRMLSQFERMLKTKPKNKYYAKQVQTAKRRLKSIEGKLKRTEARMSKLVADLPKLPTVVKAIPLDRFWSKWAGEGPLTGKGAHVDVFGGNCKGANFRNCTGGSLWDTPFGGLLSDLLEEQINAFQYSACYIPGKGARAPEQTNLVKICTGCQATFGLAMYPDGIAGSSKQKPRCCVQSCGKDSFFGGQSVAVDDAAMEKGWVKGTGWRHEPEFSHLNPPLCKWPPGFDPNLPNHTSIHMFRLAPCTQKMNHRAGFAAPVLCAMIKITRNATSVESFSRIVAPDLKQNAATIGGRYKDVGSMSDRLKNKCDYYKRLAKKAIHLKKTSSAYWFFLKNVADTRCAYYQVHTSAELLVRQAVAKLRFSVAQAIVTPGSRVQRIKNLPVKSKRTQECEQRSCKSAVFAHPAGLIKPHLPCIKGMCQKYVQVYKGSPSWHHFARRQCLERCKRAKARLRRNGPDPASSSRCSAGKAKGGCSQPFCQFKQPRRVTESTLLGETANTEENLADDVAHGASQGRRGGGGIAAGGTFFLAASNRAGNSEALLGSFQDANAGRRGGGGTSSSSVFSFTMSNQATPSL